MIVLRKIVGRAPSGNPEEIVCSQYLLRGQRAAFLDRNDVERVKDVDKSFAIRHDHSLLGEENELPMRHAKFLPVGGPKRKGNKASGESLADVFNGHTAIMIAQIG